VKKVIKEINLAERNKEQADTRVLEHLILYGEHQFGKRVTGKAYRERRSGERMDNLNADVYIMCQLCRDLDNIFERNESRSLIVNDNMRLPYLEKMLDMLRPWSAHVELSPTSGVGSLYEDQKVFVLKLLSGTERKICLIHNHRNEFREAEIHGQHAISYARVYQRLQGTEEDKTDLLGRALITFYALRMSQENYDDALIYIEEAYNCAAVTYNPVHLEVLKAAGYLITCLVLKHDYYNAERFAEVTLEAMKDLANGLDQQSEEIAIGYYNLANVIYQQKGDVVKCEMLGRESLRIRTLLHNDHHVHIGSSARLLALILQVIFLYLCLIGCSLHFTCRG
jgi:tetratricopeptide (TPR) repeat protein